MPYFEQMLSHCLNSLKSKVNPMNKYKSHISVKVPDFTLKTSVALSVHIFSSYQSLGTSRKGNLEKDDGENVKSGTK